MLAGPMVPAAPGRFSITIDWPRCFSVAAASARMPMSVDPPAGHGTIKVTGRVGNCCACAAPASASRMAAINPAILTSPSFAHRNFPVILAPDIAQSWVAPQRRRHVAYWLMKSEPDVFSWDDLVKKGAKGEPWNGVRNHTAKLNLMK